jgi:hypothetical protein
VDSPPNGQTVQRYNVLLTFEPGALTLLSGGRLGPNQHVDERELYKVLE